MASSPSRLAYLMDASNAAEKSLASSISSRMGSPMRVARGAERRLEFTERPDPPLARQVVRKSGEPPSRRRDAADRVLPIVTCEQPLRLGLFLAPPRAGDMLLI
jgi:hypothetical protein